MKRLLQWLAVALSICVALPTFADILGYVLRVFPPGENLFSPPVLAAHPPQNNSLSNLFTGQVPDSTIVSLWNPTTLSFDVSSTNRSGLWSTNLALPPGTGARLKTAIAFTNTFVGALLGHDGTPLTWDDSTIRPAPTFPGPVGVYLLGDKAATGASGTELFTNVIGRRPVTGEQVILLNVSNQTYATNTCLGDDAWDTLPTWHAGDAAFFNILLAPVPLTYSIEGSNLILSWTSPRFALATGTNLDEISSILTSTSPFTNLMAEPGQYFRLIAE